MDSMKPATADFPSAFSGLNRLLNRGFKALRVKP
jgi:hypothetical protein